MSSKILILVLLGLFVLSLGTGCLTTNWVHNRRHFKQVREDLRLLHQDFDRIVFDLEPYPTD
ncbi:MAG: hypothetical protein ABIH42_05950 [Planctomycetota bacterium]